MVVLLAHLHRGKFSNLIMDKNRIFLLQWGTVIKRSSAASSTARGQKVQIVFTLKISIIYLKEVKNSGLGQVGKVGVFQRDQQEGRVNKRRVHLPFLCGIIYRQMPAPSKSVK